MNFSIVPSWVIASSARSSKMPETSSWRISGSRSSASEVNPTKSAKSTVTRRRS